MKLESEVLQSYNKIDEQYVESLLEKEIKKIIKHLLCWMMIRLVFRRFTMCRYIRIGRKRLFARHLQKRITCSLF